MTETTLHAKSTPPAPQEALLQMISGYWLTQAIAVAARLSLADRLTDGPRHVDDLAAEAGAHPESLYRLMRALASVGVFTELDANGTFGLTPLAECLRSGVPGSLRELAMMSGDPGHYQSWGDLERVVRTGVGAMERLFGAQVFDYYKAHPEEARTFNGAMTNLSGVAAGAVLEAYDFAGIRRLMDVGGGHGFFLRSVLQAHPQISGVLFDLPEVVAGQRGDRLEVVAGDFFKGVPRGADAILMKHILHDWSDELCGKILKHCHAALDEGGRLLVVETLVPEGNGPHLSKFMDLNMLVMTPGGRERSAAQFQALFERCSFALSRVVPTRSPYVVLEAKRR